MVSGSARLLTHVIPAVEGPSRGRRWGACAVLFVLTSMFGCSPKHPGERYSAGYVFPEKQSKVVHDFVVRNTTSESVKIQRVERSCTCASFSLGQEQLAPGESTTLRINVDVMPTYMQKSATCVLKTEHPRFKDWAYTVQFTSLPFIVADPPDLNLGSFTVDGKSGNGPQYATLDLFTGSKIELKRASFSVPDEIELDITSGPEVRRLQRGVWDTRYKVGFRLSSKGRATLLGATQSALITKTVRLAGGEAGARPWQYTVFWKALAPLESHPSNLSFGNLLDGRDDHSRRVLVSSTTGETFRILSIASPAEDFRIESAVDTTEEAGSHLVKFRAVAKAASDSRSASAMRHFLSGRIQVHTTEKRSPIVEIPWSALIEPSDREGLGPDQSRSGSSPRS
jgi:hypothetical protein